MRIGLHLSTAGGAAKAVEMARRLGLDCLQIFAGSPRTWRRVAWSVEETARFRAGAALAGLDPVVIHAPYLINLAAADEALWSKSIEALTDQLRMAQAIGAAGVVVHPGSRGARPLDWGLERVAQGVAHALAAAGGQGKVILENTCGAGGALGGRLEQLAAMLDLLGDAPCAVCLDTAHAWGAGYDIASADGAAAFVDQVDGVVGLERVLLWHFNDMKLPCGCGRDIHAHLGRGRIGRAGLAGLAQDPRLAGAAAVMETPKDSRWADRRNVLYLRRIAVAR